MTLINSNAYPIREESSKPSKSSSSVTSNIGTALAVLAKNNSDKHLISNSISLHGDVSAFVNTQLNHHLSTSAINDDSQTTTKGKRKDKRRRK